VFENNNTEFAIILFKNFDVFINHLDSFEVTEFLFNIANNFNIIEAQMNNIKDWRLLRDVIKSFGE
jgi:hypothetical protein